MCFFAVFCAMWSWREKLTGCNIVIHIDNDGVRDSFISCHTTNDNAVPILNAFLQLEFMNRWIIRVPTESNVADNPSRFDVTSLIQCGCAKMSFNSCSMWRTMSDRMLVTAVWIMHRSMPVQLLRFFSIANVNALISQFIFLATCN